MYELPVKEPYSKASEDHRQQDDADSGDIVIALVNGDDGCVKKLVKYDSGGCALISLNPVYEPMVFDKAAVYEVPVTFASLIQSPEAFL